MATCEKSVGGCVASNSGDATVTTPTTRRVLPQRQEALNTSSISRLIYSLSERVEGSLDEGDLAALSMMDEQGRNLVDQVAQTAQTMALLVAADDHAGRSGAFNGIAGSHALYLLGEMAELAHTCLLLAHDADRRLEHLRDPERLGRTA